jgi:S-adenosylmethionine hydrolase
VTAELSPAGGGSRGSSGVARPVIFLLTDFGDTDPFVGIMKAVMLAGCPDAAIVDLTHAVPPQAIDVAAFWLERSLPWLPRSAVITVVVDPGVGTARLPVVAVAEGRIFVGPDNGVLAPAVRRDPAAVVHVIDVGRLGLPAPSRTFHGRDVFAPVAAGLAAGRWSVDDVGPALAALTPLALEPPVVEGDIVEGVVVTVDHFGNLITNIDRALVPPGAARVHVAGKSAELRAAYGDAEPGELVALVNAFDVLEVAERNGNAARSLGAGKWTKVVLGPDPGPRARR